MLDGSAIGLLGLAFEEPYEAGEKLTEVQLRAVSLVARQAWGSLGEYVNLINVLRAFGLPDREETMRELLGLERFPKVKARHRTLRIAERPWWKF